MEATQVGLNLVYVLRVVGEVLNIEGGTAQIPHPNMVDVIVQDWGRHRKCRGATHFRVQFMANTASGLGSSRARERAAEASSSGDEAAPVHPLPTEDEIVVDRVQTLILLYAIPKNVQV